ncbi:hypothetical protein [Aeromonas allosaccharophila]|uniref:hypothetical protein n=1 Tax=Aeromonas allosaccharophila TaxID=656 RepID=UPI0034225B2B
MDSEKDMATGQRTISDQARGSLITANGIIIGFALAFFGNWSTSGAKWSSHDIPIVAAFSVGILLLILALYRSLMPYIQTIVRYESNVRLLVLGIISIFIGVILIIKP